VFAVVELVNFMTVQDSYTERQRKAMKYDCVLIITDSRAQSSLRVTTARTTRSSAVTESATHRVAENFA